MAPTVDIVCGLPPNPVFVPFDVVPWKNIVPSLPFDALMLVLPQKVPAPVTLTSAGKAYMVKDETLPDDGDAENEVISLTAVMVMVVDPELVKDAAGTLNVALPPDIVIGAVAPTTELAPLNV